MGWITPRGPGSSFIAMIALLCQDPLQEPKRAFHFPIGRWTPISFTLEKRSLKARWEACIRCATTSGAYKVPDSPSLPSFRLERAEGQEAHRRRPGALELLPDCLVIHQLPGGARVASSVAMT